MSNHPGDPRADALGEVPFDHAGAYPRHQVVPPPPPPPTGNETNYVPYRGTEQHGVRNQRDPRADIRQPWVSEQHALDKANDQTITPRDLVPVKPVPVTIVHTPDLLKRRQVHMATYTVKPGTPVLLAPADPFRERLVLSTAPVGASADVRLYLTGDAYSLEHSAFLLPSAGALETEVTDAIYAMAVGAGNAEGARIGVWMETVQSNGDPLL